MADFPLSTKQDSSKFEIDVEDVGIRSEMEGGYVLTRPRHTRRPRRTFTTAFTSISDEDYGTFITFWNTYGTFQAFNYVVRTSGELVNVRFQTKPQFKYSGWGSNFRWDITGIKLEEV